MEVPTGAVKHDRALGYVGDGDLRSGGVDYGGSEFELERMEKGRRRGLARVFIGRTGVV